MSNRSPAGSADQFVNQFMAPGTYLDTSSAHIDHPSTDTQDGPQDRDLRAITGKPVVHLDKIPLRELIRIDAASRDAVQSVMDVTSCGLGEVEQLRKQGMPLADIAKFVASAGKLPKGLKDILKA